ncbi:MAG: ABC transporter ATP-binding protein [Acidimicrobiia bacterium]
MKNVETKEQRRYLFKLFLDASKYDRKKFWGSFVLMSIANICNDAINPIIIAHILGDIAKKQEINSIEPYIPWLIALVLVEITTVTSRRFAAYLEERFDAHCRRNVVTNIFAKLLEQPAYFHQSRFVGKTINLISKCSDCFGRTSGITIFQLVPMLISFVVTGIILIPIMPIYFLCVVIISILFASLIIKLLPRQMKLSSDASATSSKMYGAMSDAISNISAVKSESGELQEFGYVNEIGDRWLVENKRFARHTIIRDGIISNSVMRSLRVLCIVFALVAAVGNVDGVSNIYLAATLTLLYMYHLWDFGDALYDLTVAYGDAAPMVPLLQAKPGVQDSLDAADVGHLEGKIELENISYSYPNTQDKVFENLSLTINAGERIGIVGKSGAGKSTLVKLIMRFVDAQNGDIKVDGKSLHEITQESLRKNISYVAQEPMLFHRSIYENITYGAGDVNNEMINDVLTRSHSIDFINKMPKGINSVVGERGVNLSGGQRQRIAIARAMLKNAPILILDEATSALDSESEGFVQDAFANLMNERTTIVIAHRLSTLLNMDRILVFDEGKIVETGSHDELVKSGGIYSDLWEHQAGGFIPST